MCTVSYFKGINQVIITSNRDETLNRPIALPPRKLVLKNSIVYCPIDTKHNGTWFVVKNDESVFVLLNGAEKKHIPKPPYKKSRGIVLLEIVDGTYYLDNWNSIDLDRIENFTIVAYSKGKLALLRWNGSKKSHQYLDERKHHIWSSTTLYDEPTVKLREAWYFNFLADNLNGVNSDDIIGFHTNTMKDDKTNGLLIKRLNNILTKNITQAILLTKNSKINHWDLMNNEKTTLKKLF